MRTPWAPQNGGSPTTAPDIRFSGLPATLLLALGAGAMVYFPITNTDIWWHLASGRWILEHGTWPRADPFAADTMGRPWVDIHWLFQVVVYLNYRLTGLGGMVVAKSVTVGLAAVVTLRAILGPQPRWHGVAAGIALAVLFPARYLVLARPIVPTLLGIGLVLLVVEGYRRQRRAVWLLWLLPIQILWANLQSLFVLAPLLVSCYLLGEGATYLLARWRLPGFASPLPPRHLGWLALALLGVCLASLATPYGWDAVRLPLRLFDRIDSMGSALFSLNVSENVPLWLLEQRGSPLSAPFRWVALVAFGSFLLSLRSLSLPRLAVLCAAFVLAATAHRNALLLCWVAGPLVAVNLIDWLERRRLPWVQRLGRQLAPWVGVVAALGLLGHRCFVADEGPITHPAPFRVPVEAVKRLTTVEVRGPVFNSVRYGGYIAWALHADPRPHIDGRLVLRTTAEFSEHLQLLDEPDRFDAYRRRHGIRTALLPSAFPDRYLALVAKLYRDPQWALLYTDGTQNLFSHRSAWEASTDRPVTRIRLDDPQTVARLARELENRFASRPAQLTQAVVNLGRLLGEVRQLQRGIELLEAHPHRDAQSLLARLLYLDGQQERARKLALSVATRHEGDLPCQLLLAQIALERNDLATALERARRVIRANPEDPQGQQLIADVQRRLGAIAPSSSR